MVKNNLSYDNLTKISDKIYKSIYGYFIKKETEWQFTPLDISFSSDLLFDINNVLRILNDEIQ